MENKHIAQTNKDDAYIPIRTIVSHPDRDMAWLFRSCKRELSKVRIE